MKHNKQMSETFLIGAMLAIVGGFLDSYTFICRGGVFANAQTGNIVLFGIKLSEGNLKDSLHYLIPIMAFVVGIFVSEFIRQKYKDNDKIHWRQIIIAFEVLILFAIAFIPYSKNILANVLVSFVCSLQVQSFRTIRGNAVATTMCTGNLRVATECLYVYKATKNRNELQKSLQYYSIIIFFILGAVIGALLTNSLGSKTIFFPCGVLAVVFALLFKKEQIN